MIITQMKQIIEVDKSENTEYFHRASGTKCSLQLTANHNGS